MKQEETYVNLGNKQQNNNPYARTAGNNNFGHGRGTYVPGMSDKDALTGNPAKKSGEDTPVVGFLYSISRKGIGEYWPLHLGSNTIGRASDCDICLIEMSVSEHHAVLCIKQMKSARKLIASIRDTGSKNGMYLNEEELDYDNHSCKSNDIITVGTSYQLLLLLIDAEQYGLTVAENFVASDEDEAEDFFANNASDNDDSTHGRFNPYSADNRNVDTGTVDLNGAQINTPGGTKFM